MKVDGYVRVSRVGSRQGESFISPVEQRDRIHSWAKAQGFTIAKVHEDLDQPGSRSDRPGLTKTMDRVRRGTVEGIVVARLNRFGRSMLDNAKLFQEIRDAGGVLFTVAEGIDSRGAMGGLLANLFSSFAEYELEVMRDNWSTARESAVGRGIHIASRTPTGYIRGDDKRLNLDSDAAKAVADVFRAKAQGASWRELGAILEEAGVKTPYGGDNWVPRSVSHMISNRVYLGEARSGEFVKQGAHEPIIDEETFELAQVTKQPPQNGLGGALLSGLLRCAGCRYVLKADSMRDRRGEKIRLYRCRGARSSGKCPSPASVLGSVIEPWAVEQFFEGLGEVLAEAVQATGDLRDLEHRVERAELELAAYRDNTVVGVIGAESFNAGLRARVDRLSEARGAFEVAREAAGTADLPNPATLRGIWGGLEVGEQRHLLHQGIGAVFVRSVGRANVSVSDRAMILWRGEAPDDLPGPGRKVGAIRPFDWPG